MPALPYARMLSMALEHVIHILRLIPAVAPSQVIFHLVVS